MFLVEVGSTSGKLSQSSGRTSIDTTNERLAHMAYIRGISCDTLACVTPRAKNLGGLALYIPLLASPLTERHSDFKLFVF